MATRQQQIVDERNSQISAIQSEGTSQKGKVTTEGNAQVQAVKSEGNDYISAIETEGANQKSAVTGQGNAEVNRVKSQGSTEVGEVLAEGNTQVARVQAEGDAQEERLEQDLAPIQDRLDGIGETNGNLLIAGDVIIHTGSTARIGTLELNGARIVNGYNDYRELADCGSVFITRDGNDLILADLRSEFLRGWDHGRGVDDGRELGTDQGDAIRNIEGNWLHQNKDTSRLTPETSIGAAWTGREKKGTSTPAKSITGTDYVEGKKGTFGFDASLVVPTADENRPRNISVMFCIKY